MNAMKNKNKDNLKLIIPPPDAASSSSQRNVANTSHITGDGNNGSHKPPSFNRSQSVPANENNLLKKTNSSASHKPNLQRQSSFLQKKTLIRQQSKRLRDATASFVGVGKQEETDRWRLRHLQYCSQRYGKLKPEKVSNIESQLSVSADPAATHSPLPNAWFDILDWSNSGHFTQIIHDPLAKRYRQQHDSFDEASSYTSSHQPRTPLTPGGRSTGSGGRFNQSGTFHRQTDHLRKESVARMSWKVISCVVRGTSVLNNLVELPPPSAEHHQRRSYALSQGDDDSCGIRFTAPNADPLDTNSLQMPTILETESYNDEVFYDQPPQPTPLQKDKRVTEVDTASSPMVQPRSTKTKLTRSGGGRQRGQKIGVQRVLSSVFRREDRQIGKGLVGKWLNRRLTRKRMNSHVKRQIDTFDQHRPYFSYWICFVHIVITIIAITVYGIAPVGFSYEEHYIFTPKKSLSRSSEMIRVHQNFWIGPRTEDLIHLGAKYGPCMRNDQNVHKFITHQRDVERQSACCVRNDNSGCIQDNECVLYFATHVKWNTTDSDPGYEIPTYRPSEDSDARIARKSGSVCGQDPRACVGQQNPPVVEQWADDITTWPICQNKLNQTSTLDHMTCTIVGRPCCIGHGAKCEIVTEAYCEAIKGVYHSEATLCSQVDCMQDTCGLLEFRVKESPDQIYRMWLPLFLHAGVLHCVVSVVIQMTILRDMEKLAGWCRICIIYMLSGITGNLASALFLPYKAEVGPAGSLFGILACLFVEVIQNWQLLKSPSRALFKLFMIALILFIFGTLPWIDNFAHIFGFISGLLLSFTFLPYITFDTWDQRRKRLQVIVCFCLFTGMFVVLVFFFYIIPFSECTFCHYINCIPFFSKDFCSNHGNFDPEALTWN